MRYWRIANPDGKVWLLPRRNTRVALALYQPSGWKGKVLKKLLPWLSALPERLTPFPVQAWEIEAPVREILSGLFPGKALEWAVFEGTPSVHQKRVLQVYSGQEILAYGKLSAKADVIALFAQEAELLQTLGAKGLEGIPQCLYVGPAGNDGTQMLVLSTRKTTHSTVPHEWGARQQAFVEILQAKTTQMTPYEESDLAQAIVVLRQRADMLPDGFDQTSLALAMERAEGRYQGQQLACAVAHGDFTPWNMFVEQGRLFVFDWEYAFRRCPIGTDRYHFFLQTAFFERHWTAEALMAFAQTPEGAWIDINQLTTYILMILSRFVGREPAAKKMSATGLLTFWNRLLTLCQTMK